MAAQDSVFYIDAPWESVRSEVEALNKFKMSPFYAHGCNNDNPEIPLNDLGTNFLEKMVGCEYCIDTEKSVPQILWIIRQQHRYSESHSELTCAYYMLYGVIYMAPRFSELLDSRLSKTTFHIQSALDALSEFKPRTDGNDTGAAKSSPRVRHGLGAEFMKDLHMQHQSILDDIRSADGNN